MDSGELSSLDFYFLARELSARLKGGTFRKVWQYGKKQLVFEIYSGTTGNHFLYADNKRMFVAAARDDAPDEPPGFCMLLRKHLAGGRVVEVRQHGFDRVVEIETDNNIIIFEFVPPGNIILCDRMYNIVMPMESQKWKHREIRQGASYNFPPNQTDITKLEIWDFFQEISGSDRNVGQALAGMGLGTAYALEVCSRTGVRHDKPASGTTVDEATAIFNELKTMMLSPAEPVMYSDDVSVFPLVTRRSSCRPASGFSEALDTFFSKAIAEERGKADEKAVSEAVEKEDERIGRIEEAREEALEKLSERKEEKKSGAQAIYKHYDIISNILTGVKSARDSGMSWEQIKSKLAASASREAKAVKEIRENEGIIMVELEGSLFQIDMRKTPEENAGLMFDDAKKIKRKIERIESLPKPEPKPMDKLIEEVQFSLTGKKLKERKPRAAKPRKGKRWYETYRWFISSEGNVVVAGKNALQNDSVIKSRFKEGDAAFHADIHGAAFVVAKADGEGKVGPLTVKEAAEFAAAHSKAWASGFTEVDVSQFRPGTLSKTAPDGAKLPRGSFHANGTEAVHEKVDVRLSVGVSVGDDGVAGVFAGPLMPVRKSCRYFVTIQPGGMEGNELAQKIKNGILARCMPEHRRPIEALPPDEFSRHIPGGSGSLVGG